MVEGLNGCVILHKVYWDRDFQLNLLNMLVVTMDFPVDVESGSSRYFIGILKKGNHLYNQDQLRINLGSKPIPFQFPFHRFFWFSFVNGLFYVPPLLKSQGQA